MSNTEKIWFITGTSKGLGLSLTKLALSQGDKVAATTRNIEALRQQVGDTDNLLPLQVDITSDEAVKAAVDQVIEKFGRIDVVVNNAGYSLVGSMEEMTDKEFRETMDVNLFATVNVIRNTIPHLRAQQHGHIINISSNAGYIGFSMASSYNAAKFAMIGLSEALAQEVKDFGIKVTVVGPGQFRTEFMNSINYVTNRIDIYGVTEAEKMWSSFSGKQPGDPEKLVAILVQIANMEQPPLQLLLGSDTYELVKAKRTQDEAEFERWKELTLSTDF